MKVSDEMVERATVYLIEQTDIDGQEASGLAFEMLKAALLAVSDEPAWVKQLAALWEARADVFAKESAPESLDNEVAICFRQAAAELRARARQP